MFCNLGEAYIRVSIHLVFAEVDIKLLRIVTSCFDSCKEESQSPFNKLYSLNTTNLQLYRDLSFLLPMEPGIKEYRKSTSLFNPQTLRLWIGRNQLV
jgi:hypothetical protein